jgi:hypothetical protein
VSPTLAKLPPTGFNAATPLLPTAQPANRTPKPTVAQEQPASAVIFSDNFDGGISPAWQSISGNWLTSDGQAIADNGACGKKIIGLPQWDNFALDLDVQLGVSYNLNIFLAYESEDKYTVINISSVKGCGTCGIHYYLKLVVNGSVVPQSVRDDDHQGVRLGKHIRIEVQGPHLKLLTDQNPIYDYVLNSSVAGKVGVEICPGELGIDNFEILALPQ